MVLLVFVHFESCLRVSFVVEDHHLSVWILIRVPPLYVTLLIGNFMSLLWILMIARCEAKLVTMWPMYTLLSIGATKSKIE